ncbi:hypothetical protein I6N95_15815 [Vagococcus sp. BWB3-3]|uniref:Uncharacterized protein n=1 Tax=Vagococcus allomyrinae TaxID=2794353 RepID=A0A940PFB4_9ENTE|nr:hypothetical protein [Vagococcus allomyrinae]MBP1042486.1 hypothetical protein [Vagococcus allomyrinae]
MKKISSFTFNDMTIHYYQTSEAVEWLLVPTALKDEVILPKKVKYDSLVQVKLVGDDYAKGFCTGSTMRNSQTVKNLQFVDQKLVTREGGTEVRTRLDG